MGISILIHTYNNIMKFLSLALIGYASADLSDFLNTKEEASQHLVREKRGVDPDAWCKNDLKAPKCWEEFTETVWKPRIITSKNMVSRKEGWKLYSCVKKCTIADGAKDLIGKAYEENREKQESVFFSQEDFLESRAAERKFVT